MSITLQARPEDARVLTKIGFLARTTPETFVGYPGGDLSIASPFSVYIATAPNLTTGKLLETAMLNAWEYVIMHSGVVIGLAEATPQGNPPVLTCSAVYPPKVAEPLITAIEQAESMKIDGNAELRVLKVPEINFRAVWLHDASSRDLLLPVPPSPVALQVDRLFTEEELINLLRPIAEQRTASPNIEKRPL